MFQHKLKIFDINLNPFEIIIPYTKKDAEWIDKKNIDRIRQLKKNHKINSMQLDFFR